MILLNWQLNRVVESARDIFKSFDKAALTFRMFQSFMTFQTFTKGIKYYLKARNFSSLTLDDLHQGMQKAYDEDFPENGNDIGEAMKTWEDVNGYPVVHVEKTDGKFVLTQTNEYDYQKYNETFTIPIIYKTKSGKISKVLMKTKQMTIESDSPWIVLNVNETGFYKVKHGKELTFALAEELKENLSALSEDKRKRILEEKNFDDDDRESILAKFSYLKHENISWVWAGAYRSNRYWGETDSSFEFINNELVGTEVYLQYHKFVISLIEPHFDRLGFFEIENEPSNDKELREILIKIAQFIDYEEYLKMEVHRFIKFLETGKGYYHWCDGLKLANATIHSQLAAEKMNQSLDLYNGRRHGITDLSCSLDRQVLINLLRLTTSYKLVNDERTSIFGQILLGDFGREVALKFILERFNDVVRHDS